MVDMTTPLIGTTGVKTPTRENGIGLERDERSELFITAVSSLMQNTFYESSDEREARLVSLVRHVTLEDPLWVFRFIRWLRDEANMRSAAVLVACEFVKARVDAGVPDESRSEGPGLNRTAINVACLRADEPGEVLAYWIARHGRRLPMPVKRGVADAVQRLYNERSALRYDGDGRGMRMGDVIELVHPRKKADWQGALYEWLLNRRHGHKATTDELLSLLPVISDAESGRSRAKEDTEDERERLLENPAAITSWEYLSSLGPMDARAWEAVIPSMGYMALLRNLRNFDQAGISETAVNVVKSRLVDPDAVTGSRQFPFRFFSAYKHAGERWHGSLADALNTSLSNVPSLSGRTLIMVDRSGSMYTQVSAQSSVLWAEQAALFGTALAMRCEDALLVQYGTSSRLVKMSATVLRTLGEFTSMGGTNTAHETGQWVRSAGPFDRVVIVTDEQSYSRYGATVGDAVPDDTMLFTFNLAGYGAAQAESGPYRHTFGGLTDQSFRMIPLIEAGVKQDWPF